MRNKYKYKYVLQHKKTRYYLNYIKSMNYNHYVPYIEEATKFDYSQAKYRKSKFKHNENWEIKKVRSDEV